MPASTRHTNIVAAYLVLKRDNEVLLLQRANTGYEDGNYSVIAGHLEPGESFQAAIIREAKEEANITIEPQHILHTHVQHRKSDWDQTERVDVYFLVEQWSGELCNNEPEKCTALEWFPADKLPENTIVCVREAIQRLLERHAYSEIGWE